MSSDGSGPAGPPSTEQLNTEAALTPGVSVEIVPPDRRECQRCGRRDEWDEAAGKWVIAVEDGERRVGNKHCVHEWDIDGAYNPVEGPQAAGEE